MSYNVKTDIIVGATDVNYGNNIPACLVVVDHEIVFTRFAHCGCHRL